MKTAVILSAGMGTKIWPYAEIRSKVMIPVSNKPIISYTVDILCELQFDNIIIVSGKFNEGIRNYFRNYANISVITDMSDRGTAFSLLSAKEFVRTDEFCVFYGDTILSKNDIETLTGSFDKNQCPTVLASHSDEKSGNYIGCTMEEGALAGIMGHAREGCTHFVCAYALKKDFFNILAYNSCRFTNTQVGMMSPMEGYLEMSLVDYMDSGNQVMAVVAQDKAIDIDKPWHILMANEYTNRMLCDLLTGHELSTGSKIDASASIKGYVRLGENSVIGKNVIIEGNIIVGDNTVIENGAILKGNNVIGNHCYVGNYCYIEQNSTIGHHCVVNHCAELSGIIMNKVYLYHYMEFYGIIGENTDLGAATVCGTLRFDDGVTTHFTKGRREIPISYDDATYLGDYCRTGVNAIIMPGTKVGVYSVVGSGVILAEDVPNNTLIYCEQKLVQKKWGHEKYGW
jgi:UDP-N-acetylglucosamine diphosphorylase / glucose-1-phosphate thymidylyltransferase / UDP-N-acetylgalactosamine diphosphorylase / glucosamine-1-phosphate N-acetyltransferase / galactosamine-1-phosphate N-acetyltransferase